MHLEARSESVERRGAHAYVERQASHEEAMHPVPRQLRRKPRPVEGRELVAIEADALDDLDGVGRQLEIWMELRARTALDAVRGPCTARILEAGVAARMPVTRDVDGNTGTPGRPDPAVQDGDDAVALGNGQGAARTEVALHVHEQESVSGPQRQALRSRPPGHHSEPRLVVQLRR